VAHAGRACRSLATKGLSASGDVMAERDDADVDGALVSRWRDPPGWFAAILRTAAISFRTATSVDDIRSHYSRLALIVCEETAGQ
jgi:hypothetical protein